MIGLVMRLKEIFDLQDISRYRQELMGIAIIGVLISHLVSVCDFDSTSILIRILLVSKQLVYTQGFLFLSGFGLYYSMSRNNDTMAFYKRRIARLLVPYIIMSAPFFLFQIISRGEPWLLLLGRLTTISYWWEGNYSGMWYVAVSMLLYMIFPVYYKFVYKQHKDVDVVLIRAVSFVVFSVLVVSLLRRIEFYHATLEFGCAKIPAFFIGSLLAYIVQNRGEITSRQMIKLIVSLLILGCIWVIEIVYDHDLEGRAIMTKFLFIPLCCITINLMSRIKYVKLINSVLRWLGKYTLEIYVLHLMFLKTPELLPSISLPTLLIIGIVFSITFCIPYSLLSKWVVMQIERNSLCG